MQTLTQGLANAWKPCAPVPCSNRAAAALVHCNYSSASRVMLLLSTRPPCTVCHAASPAGDAPGNQPPAPGQQASKPGLLGKLKGVLLGDSSSLDRKRLAELGMGAFAAYGVISNVNAGILLTLAWLTVVKTQGVTPLAPGMWSKFLGVYAGLWVSSHFMRPIRLSLALAAAPAFDAALVKIMKWTGLNKAVAFGIMLVCIAVGTMSLLLTTIWLCGGFPPSPAA